MRLVAIEIQGFRGWKERAELRFDTPITAIVAPNKAGKSSTLNAIEWCFYGDAVCKSASGIDERAAWEIAPRGGDGSPTEVRLTLQIAGESAVVMRTVDGGGPRKGKSSFEVRTPAGTQLFEADATSWLCAQGLPDWETYRRAHCFHQESARTRILSQADRSAVLASLLGLDDDLRVREAIKKCGDSKPVGAIDEELDGLQSHVESVLGRPRKEMEKIEARLAARGIARAQVHEGKALEVRGCMLVRAGTLAAKLGIEVTFPDQSDGVAVERWAHEWPQTAGGSAPALAPLAMLRKRQASLDAAIGSVGAFEVSWTAASRSVEEATKKDGGRAAREERRKLARGRAVAAKEAVERANERVALLRDTQRYLTPRSDASGAATGSSATSSSERCPVCDTPVSGLLSRIEREIETSSSVELFALAAERDKQAKEESDAIKSLEDLSVLERALADAEHRRQLARANLESSLAGEIPPDTHDVLAAARKLLETLRVQITDLQGLESARAESLAAHAKDIDLLLDLERWLAAARSADSQLDAQSLPAYAALDAAIDDASGFAADLEAVAEMARDAQAERSAARESEVNRGFGKYYAMIVGDASADGVVIKTKQSGHKVVYELVDQTGRQAVPILNQASINALSLALLFAQAEERAIEGGFECVVLDDPVQSLDDERQGGLAAAIEELSKTCEVIVAATQSPLVDRIEKYVSVPRTLQFLEPWDASASRLGARRAL
jgi:DNA repair exonuclease SbcCD ATPase subunit